MAGRFGVAVFVFVVIFHIFLTMTRIYSSSRLTEQAALKASARIHDALLSNDEYALRDSLWTILGKDATWLSFHSDMLSRFTASPLRLGSVNFNNPFEITRKLEIRANGLTLGEVHYHLDVLAITAALLLENLALYALVALFIFGLLAYVQSGIVRQLLRLEEDLTRVADLPRTVAHDIRSPLTALDLVLASTAEISENRRDLARAAIGRIQDIAKDLLQAAPPAPLFTEPVIVRSLLTRIAAEKRIQNRGEIRITGGDPQLRVHALPKELARILANLTQNALEALPRENGWVELSLTNPDKHHVSIEIRDNGKGIPADVLPKLGQRGFSFGKGPDGHGLGLYQAKRWVESWGGRLEITSAEGKGTSIRLILLRAPAAEALPAQVSPTLNGG